MPISSSTPPPSSNISSRSIPGKMEKSPSWAISAMEMRQSKASPSAGTRAISVVIPPPFFQAMRR
ncbi:hypothetical protein NM961_04425 [Tahibacter sp. P2K]|uniref:Uncharacterized protein n=1 Tax=Tahibacter harae TaxID=2963937 RepID=A0ABT1QP46_9GAMM|nr:hypothetical protein [Tahibacter harae]MCQ4163950.1 hypothetical protein [Tahibacter harae]